MERLEIGLEPFKGIKAQYGVVAWIKMPCVSNLMIDFRKLWDALSGHELHSFEHKYIVRACAFSEVQEKKIKKISDMNVDTFKSAGCLIWQGKDHLHVTAFINYSSWMFLATDYLVYITLWWVRIKCLTNVSTSTQLKKLLNVCDKDQEPQGEVQHRREAMPGAWETT